MEIGNVTDWKQTIKCSSELRHSDTAYVASRKCAGQNQRSEVEYGHDGSRSEDDC